MGVTAGEVLARLEALGTEHERAKLARYGIPDGRAIGIAMRDIIALGKEIGTDHTLAGALWADGRYEARSLAAFLGDPAALTGAQMDAWAKDFDSWAICDTVCFRLFDRTPLAWTKAADWAAADAIYVRRAGLALIWGLSVHDKATGDAGFTALFPLIETAAQDPRDHVWKGASMALRACGKRSVALRQAALVVADRLIVMAASPASGVGRAVRRDLA